MPCTHTVKHNIIRQQDTRKEIQSELEMSFISLLIIFNLAKKSLKNMLKTINFFRIRKKRSSTDPPRHSSAVLHHYCIHCSYSHRRNSPNR